MSIFELFLVSIAICADSFASSVMVGISSKDKDNHLFIKVACLFATFQSLMPVLGYLLINIFSTYLVVIDHFIAFFMLSYLGISLIKGDGEDNRFNLSLKGLIMLSVAVTIDALTVGITYSVLHVFLPLTIIINFLMTLFTSLIGLYLGTKIGHLIKEKTSKIGGIILILLGLKILLSHLLA